MTLLEIIRHCFEAAEAKKDAEGGVYQVLAAQATALAAHTNLAEGFLVFIAVIFERGLERPLADEILARKVAVGLGELFVVGPR